MSRTEFVAAGSERAVKGLPVAVILTQCSSQPYTEGLAASSIAPETVDYLLANPGVTIDGRRRTVVGVGRLTGRTRAATNTRPPMVEVSYTPEPYTGNSAEEAMQIIEESWSE